MTGLLSFERLALSRFKNEAAQRQASAAARHEALQHQRERLVSGPRASTSAYYRGRTLQDMVNLQHDAAYHSAMARCYLLAVLQMQEEGE